VSLDGGSGADSDCGGSWGWIPITSMVLIGSAFILVVVISILYMKIYRVRRLVGGHNAVSINRAMRMVEEQIGSESKRGGLNKLASV